MKECELSGGELEMINNWMELLVVINVLEVLDCVLILIVVIDSVYVKGGIIEWMYGWKWKGWKIVFNKLVKNEDFWKRFD